MDPHNENKQIVQDTLYPQLTTDFENGIDGFRALYLQRMGQGNLSLDEAREAEEKMKDVFGRLENSTIADAYNHTLLAKIGGFRDVNHLYEVLMDENNESLLEQSSAVRDVMHTTMPLMLQNIADKNKIPITARDRSYYEVFSLTSLVSIDPIPTNQLEGINYESDAQENSMAHFVRSLLEKTSALSPEEIDEFIAITTFTNTNDDARCFYYETGDKLELKLNSSSSYYGLYSQLEELGHAIDFFLRKKDGKELIDRKANEEFATAFQEKALPFLVSSLKEHFDFAEELPDNYDKDLEKLLYTKRAFFLAHKATQLPIEYNYYKALGEVVSATDSPITNDQLDDLGGKANKLHPIAQQLKADARKYYSYTFGIKEEGTPDWRMPMFVSDMYPGPISAQYFSDMAGDFMNYSPDITRQEIENQLTKSMNHQVSLFSE